MNFPITDNLLLPDHLRQLPRAENPDRLQPLSPEEEDSLLSTVGNKALGGLHFLGGSLEKATGGRAIRGLLGGHTREALSVLPFSDTLGITDEKDRVSGEDLLKQWGVLQGDGQKGTFEARDLAGPALEVALDPATYLSFGTSHALTAAGEAAEKAGTLAPTMTGRIAAGQAGLASVGLPFTKGTPILTGATGEAIAKKAAQWGDKALYSAPGRVLSGLFDPSVTVNGATLTTAEGQRAARQANTLVDAAQATARGRYLEAARPLSDAGILESSGPELRAILEQTASPLPYTQGGAALKQSSDIIRNHLDTILQEGQAAGRPLNELVDQFAGFAPRQATLLDRDSKPLASLGGGARTLGSHTSNEQARIDLLRNIPGGTAQVNQLLKDASVRGPALQASNDIARRYLGVSAEHEDLLHGLNALGVGLPTDEATATAYLARNGIVPQPGQDVLKLATFHRMAARKVPNSAALEPIYDQYLKQIGTRTPRSVLEALQAAKQQAAGLADWLPTLDPRYVAQQLDFFGNHPLTDFGLYALRNARANVGAGAATNLLAEAAKQSAGPAFGMTHIVDALQGAGLGKDTSVAFGGRVAGSGGQPGGLKALEDALAARGKTAPAGSLGPLYNAFVPDDVARDVARFQHSFARPEVLDPVLKAWDTATNLIKTGQTSLWPAFHARNFLTGLWQNFVGHAGYGEDYFSPFAHANALRKGDVVPGAAEIFAASHPGISDQEATRLLAEELFQTNTRAGLSGSQAGEAIGLGTHERPVPLTFPGTSAAAQPGIGEQLAGLARGDWLPHSLEEANPFNVRGVMGREETKNTIVKAGQELGSGVDDINRISSYLAFRKQGYDPMVAAAKSKALHYDYSNLTPFEREVMRRVIPFYNWSRQNIPTQLERLLTEPGGRTATAIKVSDSLRSDDTGFVPEYLSQGLAIPLGQEADGKQRYLSHFGLPFEDLAQQLGTGQHPVLRTGEKILGQTNPLIKMPLETITGQQFYSGRDLEDLYGYTNNTLLDQLITNSPVGRLAGTIRTLGDDRKDVATKAFNILGPGKVTDVDLDKQRAVASRQIIEDALKGNKAVHHFEELSVKPENLSQLSPQELLLYRLYRTMELEGQKKGREAKAQQIGILK